MNRFCISTTPLPPNPSPLSPLEFNNPLLPHIPFACETLNPLTFLIPLLFFTVNPSHLFFFFFFTFLLLCESRSGAKEVETLIEFASLGSVELRKD
ncbi:hypothetical protein I3842_10G032000 [Carya illinoinensis]|uniref:Uncharacterized protein n=1 Tax=Carya illinoinensis TaxID=32201 RepID=A0A922DV25_CARIL|nr:hypothetical protein I3842_10G032000 [Carya illinoinensis]